MAGPPWTSEENITTLLLVPYVKRDKLTEILKALHENEERRYCFNERTAEAVNSHVGRMIKDLRIDRSNSNLSPAAIACRIAQEWDKKGEDPFLTDFIDTILEEIKMKFHSLNWTEIEQRVRDIKGSLPGSGQISREYSN